MDTNALACFVRDFPYGIYLTALRTGEANGGPDIFLVMNRSCAIDERSDGEFSADTVIPFSRRVRTNADSSINRIYDIRFYGIEPE